MNKKNQSRIKFVEGIKKVPAPSKNGINLSGFHNCNKRENSLKAGFRLSAAQAAKGGLTVLISVLIAFTIVQAGSLTPSASPAATGYTLSDIYTRLTTNATSTAGNHIFSPGSAPAGTLYTLTEIYGAIPTIDPTKLLSDTEYLGITGAIADNGAFGLACGVSNQSVTAGYYSGGTLLGDADLVASNIADGVNIFGVDGSHLASPTYGDNIASQVLNTASNPGTYDVATCTSNYNTLNLSAGTVKKTVAFGDSLIGDYPSDSYFLPGDTGATDATSADMKTGLEAWTKAGVLMTGSGTKTLSSANDTVSAGYYDATTLSAVDTDLISGNILAAKTIFGVAGKTEVVDTTEAAAPIAVGTVLENKVGFVNGSKITGSAAVGANVSGNNGSLSFTIPDGFYSGSKTCTASDTNLTVSNIKKGASVFGINGAYSGYPGTGWVANGSGSGSTALTQAACDAAYLADNYRWQWFEDGNGDGDTTDPEDGVCVLMCTGAGCTNTANYSNHGITSANWGGTETTDNTYIAEYTCSGNFPTGVVVPGATYPPAGTCALCVADCYDGKKDLPDQGTYTAPDTACDASFELCYEGPITPEILKNWTGTRLPTSNDFFGFCGNGTATVATGRYGTQVGRTDEYVNTADDSTYEWLSEQRYINYARIAGNDACSYFASYGVYTDARFRAVFRP